MSTDEDLQTGIIGRYVGSWIYQSDEGQE